MYLGRVAGCVWATVKDANLEGQRLLIVQPITPGLTDTGKQVLCTDCTGAGAGEIVYWTRGKEASFPFLPKEVPTDMTVVGIVDSVNLGRDPAARPLAVQRQKPSRGRNR
jgi:ethanolamine utilization protein EutN